MEHQIYIGTSGWSYRHWMKVFYPEDLKPSQFLEYYFKHFNSVEINSSFYHLPKIATVQRWKEISPPEFRFCVKLSRFITHRKKLSEVSEPLDRFFEVFESLRSKMGPVLIQLPPSMRWNRNLIENFLQELVNRFSGYQFALEARHSSWDNQKAVEILKFYGIAMVIAHSGKRFPYFEKSTANFSYYRFHGPAELYASNYSDKLLQEFAIKIKKDTEEGKTVWAFFNNDFGGFAIANARRLRQLVTSV